MLQNDHNADNRAPSYLDPYQVTISHYAENNNNNTAYNNKHQITSRLNDPANNNNNNNNSNNNNNNMASDFFTGFDELDENDDKNEINFLTDEDLGNVLADPSKFQMLSEALQLSPMDAQSQSQTQMMQQIYSDEHYGGTNKIGIRTMLKCELGSENSFNTLNINDNNNSKLCQNNNLIPQENNNQFLNREDHLQPQQTPQPQQEFADGSQLQLQQAQQQQQQPPALPPIVISPADVDNITIQLEKNQQCACKDCGKLFNSVWYLKQHAVKHSNDRPFKCRFCMKTYKFRSNLYQHKCPERNRHFGGIGAPSFRKRLYTRGIGYTELYSKTIEKAETQMHDAMAMIEYGSQEIIDNNAENNNNDRNNAADDVYSGRIHHPHHQHHHHHYQAYHSQHQISSEENKMMSSTGVYGATSNAFITNPSASNLQSLSAAEPGDGVQQIFPSNSNSNSTNDLQEINPSFILKSNNNKKSFVENGIPSESTMMSISYANGAPYYGMPYGIAGGGYDMSGGALLTPQIGCIECCFGGCGGYGNLSENCDDANADENYSIRETPLEQDYIDSYIQKNKNRVYQCRKCKLSFPSREYLDRHNAYHNTIECEPFVCSQCPQRFASEKLLQSHYMQHSDNSPHRCMQCFGVFRSAIALRRHKVQCRRCYCPPFGIYPKLMISPSAPLDPYGFVESEEEIERARVQYFQQFQANNFTGASTSASTGANNATYFDGSVTNENGINSIGSVPSRPSKTMDSGVGSDCSTTISPNGAEFLEEDVNYDSKSSNCLETICERRGLKRNEKGIEEEDDEDEEERDVLNQINVSKTNRKVSSSQIAMHYTGRDEEMDSGFRSRLDSMLTLTSESYSPPASAASSSSSSSSNSLLISSSHPASASVTGRGLSAGGATRFSNGSELSSYHNLAIQSIIFPNKVASSDLFDYIKSFPTSFSTSSSISLKSLSASAPIWFSVSLLNDTNIITSIIQKITSSFSSLSALSIDYENDIRIRNKLNDFELFEENDVVEFEFGSHNSNTVTSLAVKHHSSRNMLSRMHYGKSNLPIMLRLNENYATPNEYENCINSNFVTVVLCRLIFTYIIILLRFVNFIKIF